MLGLVFDPLQVDLPFNGKLTALTLTEPLRVWIIQLGMIVTVATIFAAALQRIRQPTVIAEVLGGIVLGPTVCGRIPGFTEYFFPQESRPYLNLTADIGLCLFLFLVGLEIDGSSLKRNLRHSATVALAGIVIPFAVGAGLSVLLYDRFISQDTRFSQFLFFSGTAFSVTAFPLLCRILTESNLLDTTVGMTSLSAGAGNDMVGWGLLILSVAIPQTGFDVSTVYIILGCVSWTLFLFYLVQPGMKILATKTGSIENGPSVGFLTITILILFASILVSDINGVHAIFGAFVMGLIIPREGNLAIALAEKLEDMVDILFLPLYFSLLGMSTDLTLLDDPITWVYTLGIILSAFVSKFGSCTLVARYTAGFTWRESCAIGSLMSCKGLVELIVLDLGLSAGIVTERVFTMFALEALILTFATTPLVNCFYPPHSRMRRFEATTYRRNSPGRSGGVDSLTQKNDMRRITILLDRPESLPGVMEFSTLLAPTIPIQTFKQSLSSSSSVTKDIGFERDFGKVLFHGFRLIELSDRPSGILKSSMTDIFLKTDPLLTIFRTFCHLHAFSMTASVDVVLHDGQAKSLTEHAHNYGSDMIVLQWHQSSANATSSHAISLASDLTSVVSSAAAVKVASNILMSNSSSVNHSHFLQAVLEASKTKVAIFVDQNVDNAVQEIGSRHLFVPFLGGRDDRLALEFVVRCCRNEGTTATITRVIESNEGKPMSSNVLDLADTITWEEYASTLASERIKFQELATSHPLHASISEAESSKPRGSRLLVVVGRGRGKVEDRESYSKELKDLMTEYGGGGTEMKKAIGDVASAFVVSRCGSGVIVLQDANL